MKMCKKIVALILIISVSLTLTMGCANQKIPTGINVKLNKVISGQTIEVIIDSKPRRVRLSGIDTPFRESKEWQEESKQELVKLLTNNYQQTINEVNLILETNLEQVDKYNRLNGYVWREGKQINQQLLEVGYALANLEFTNGKYDQDLILAQDYARVMDKGAWHSTANQESLPLTINN